MTQNELWTSGVGSDHSANWATTTAHRNKMFLYSKSEKRNDQVSCLSIDNVHVQFGVSLVRVFCYSNKKLTGLQ